MDRPIILVTGSNTGLGFEIVRALFRSSKAYTVLLGSRSEANAESVVHQLRAEFPNSETLVSPVQVDLEDDESIQKAFNYVSRQFGRVDVLINNAGKAERTSILPNTLKQRLTKRSIGGQFDQQMYSGSMTMREMWNKSWNVNTTGTQILTHTFMPLLLRSQDPRLLFITSGTSTLTEAANPALFVNRPPEQGWPKATGSVTAYRASKTGMNMMMREWTRILEHDGVKTFCVSPGFLATGLGGNQERNREMGAIDPAIGAEFIREVVEGFRDKDKGMVVRRDGIQPW
ncbi:hypothetical protein N7528_005979 [Penicillium herquei]|nr:hypothetical protein N7528_005979 [Penicillium herquei]